MEMTVTFGSGMKVNAHFKHFTVNTDQAKKVGGDETFPDPFSYFLRHPVSRESKPNMLKVFNLRCFVLKRFSSLNLKFLNK